ncbi:MAG: AbrB/MazE/SpoVT family DNA-binding domain-containing protein [Methylobacterium mesophilicum]|nr:AbrB/MazE/SpoVT family DNA-binding domain-containing protein [Methylobacterium mesophilicum]
MGNEYRAKVFKSGNSVALRLPKGVGFSEGDDVVIVSHDDGSFSIWREANAAGVLDSLYGAFSAGFMAAGRGEVDQAERSWETPPRDTAA